MGITIPGKCAGSVRRNRIKRVIREHYRTSKERFPTDGMLLFLLRNCDSEERIIGEMFRLTELAVTRSRKLPASGAEK
jgi:RNase P protein component